MLRNEGLSYAVITILLSITLGGVISYSIFDLFQKSFTYAQFSYPLIPILVVYLIPSAMWR